MWASWGSSLSVVPKGLGKTDKLTASLQIRIVIILKNLFLTDVIIYQAKLLKADWLRGEHKNFKVHMHRNFL